MYGCRFVPLPRLGGWHRRAVTYLRCTIGRWTIDLGSEEAREAFRLIDEEGAMVFGNQPGFVVRYRPMVAYHTTTIAVAERESEESDKPGTRRYGEWLKSSGIDEKLSLETYDGEVVADSRTIELRRPPSKRSSVELGPMGRGVSDRRYAYFAEDHF